MRMHKDSQLPAYAQNLNEAQLKALMHHQGPAMILAGPGSGKTTVLTGRVQYLISKHNVAPSSILVITYTKAAALSMQQRFIRENKGEVKPVVFGTFHSICYQILKNQYHLKNDCLLSEQEKIKIIKSLLIEQNQNTEFEDVEVLLGCISMRKTGFLTEQLPLPQNIQTEIFEGLYQAYIKKCIAMGKMDFDDMLLRCLTLFSEKEEVLKKWQARFKYILVDEFQDCDRTQFAILNLLAGEEANLFVVGDDDQSIYGFRGATPGIMKQFAEIYPHAEKIYLETNYRSIQGIVDASNAVIAENKDRFQKTMYAANKERAESRRASEAEPGTWETKSRTDKNETAVTIKSFEDKKAQQTYLFERIKNLSSRIPYQDMAVIFRTNREASLLIPGLEEAGIPYTLRGKRKSKYAHFSVRDIVAYLQAASGLLERGVFLAFMNKPMRGMDRDKLPEGNINLKELEERYLEEGNAETADKIALLQKHLIRISGMSPWPAISYIRKVVGYDNWLMEKAGGDRDKLEEWLLQLDSVHNEAKAYTNLQEWINYVKRSSDKIEESAVNDGVQLITLHSAKGLEFSYVCIPDVNEGIIPHGRMISAATREEERRLFYVGMTRAKKALDILYLTGTKDYPKLPSGFLNPLLKNYSSTNSSNS